VYNTSGEITHVPLGPRLEALFDLRDEVAHTPIIVAVPFIHTAHRLRDEIAGRGLKVEVILGDTKMADRADIVRRFQEGTVDFLLAHPKTLSHGVTLHKSHTVCWFGAIWDLELYHQFNGRIDRYGQKAQPLIVEFASTPLERKVYAALRSKQQIQGKFLELMAR
jgi:SNF2 family DNA or RNA helicase